VPKKGITLLLIRFNSGFFEGCGLRGSAAMGLPVIDNGTCSDGRLGCPADAKQGGTVTTAENQPGESSTNPSPN
jgi:hypothetical protein